MEVNRAKFHCSQCGLSFLFENTFLLHTQNIHKNSDLNKVIGSVENKVREYVGERISIVVGVEQKSSADVSPPPRPCGDMVYVKPQRGRRGEKCTKCSFMTCNLSLLLEHELLEHNTKPVPVFYCGYPACSFPFSTTRQRDDHEKAEHGRLAPPPFACKFCRKKFSKWGPAQVKHYNVCSRRLVFRCPCSASCSYQSRRQAGLHKHVQTVHFQSLAGFTRDQYEVRPGQDSVKQEEVEVKTESQSNLRAISEQEQREYYEEDEETKVLSQGSQRGSVCPFDCRKFPSVESLHHHLHQAHLDTGTDSLDCPLGQDNLHCFCGRKTNCRLSLVLHVKRCQVNNSAERLRGQLVVETNPEAGSLATRRKAARRCEELGIRDRPSKDERLKRAQLKMCTQLASSHSKEEVEQVIEQEEDDPEELDDDLSVTNESQNEAEVETNHPKLPPAKRKRGRRAGDWCNVQTVIRSYRETM